MSTQYAGQPSPSVQAMAARRVALPTIRAFVAAVRARVIDAPGGAAGRPGLFSGQTPNVPGHDVWLRAIEAELAAMEGGGAT